ncbi:MCE family protein [Nocardioides panacisoli]|uniref:MCE family protein n=1 Tax=Nocardioides panacisoli TaxID=627624 RepID=UPI001C62CFA7|nr:MCE family protein [Nocardioides panacisoli]QYJ04868.1 MCE family protein [Nocardioides panacisoli]
MSRARPQRPSVRRAALPLLAAALLAVTGCGTTMRDVPVPGTGVSGETIEIVAEFDDALNLADGAPVKVNGVDSGKVTEISVEDFTAEVTLTVRTAAQLRQGASARLRYTTPLGEMFVDVTNPADGALLREEAVLGVADTDTAPTVENALSSASLLINGGGLEQLRTVTDELNTVLVGNEQDIKDLLRNANAFLAEANRTTGSIDRVLSSLNSVSRTLADRQDVLNRVITDIRPAARVLRRATPDFTALLAEVERFSDVANQTVQVTRERLLSLLSEVQPVLAELASNRNRMNQQLQQLTRAGGLVEELVSGDYVPIGMDLDLAGLQLRGGVGGVVGGLLEVLGLEQLADDLGILDQLDILDGGLNLLGRPSDAGAGGGGLLGPTGSGRR